MADNETTGTGKPIATDKVTYSGDADQNVQLVRFVQVTGTEGSKTVVDLPGDATDGQLVNLGANNDVTVTSGTITAVTAITNALPAGTNNIGDVDVLTAPGTAAEAAALPSVFVVVAGDDGTDTHPLQQAADGDLKVTLDSESVAVTGTFWQATQPVSGTVSVSGTVTVDLSTNNDVLASGDAAHDAADTGNPVKIGAKAIAHGANPTAVAAADRTDLYANRHGVLFVIGGHPNIITRSVHIGDADGAQTDASIVGTINAGTKVAVTALAVTCDSANTGATACKIGFGATTIPADSTTGANGVLLDHDGIAAGSGVVVGNGSGLLGIGADGEELRLTCEDPVGGAISITFSYFTIES